MTLVGRVVQLPEAVGQALEHLFGRRVDHVRIIEHSLFVRLHGRAVVTTRRRCIYLRSSAADFFDNPWLMLHEYWHVIGQWESRTLTVRNYLAECVRRGYWNNRFEVEARAFADAHVHQLRAMLSRQAAAVGPAGVLNSAPAASTAAGTGPALAVNPTAPRGGTGGQRS